MLNKGGGMPPEKSTLDCNVILLFAARLLASNGPGTLLPFRLCWGQVMRKNRAAACERRSSEIQTVSATVLRGDGTARQQAMGGRRIKRGGHRMGFHAAVVVECCQPRAVSIRKVLALNVIGSRALDPALQTFR